MKTFDKNIKSKIGLFGIASCFAGLMFSSSAFAYGPERQTFTMEEPADYVTFNSITNNNVLGDERNFVRVAEVGANGEFSDEVKIVPGKEYEIYIGYHNNAKSRLNFEAGSPGMAMDVRISSQFPGKVNAANKGTVSAIISSSNANPKEVWDEAYFTTDSTADVILRYVDNSATIYNGWKLNNTKLSEALFSSEGIYIGVNELNGYLPGCAEYSGHIIYRVRAEQVGASVKKEVSLNGNDFSDVVHPKPGDTITYRVTFENTGTTDLTNVTLHDKMPTGVSLVPDTTKLVNISNPSGVSMANTIDGNGFNIGLYGPGATAVVTYQAKVSDLIVDGNDKRCGDNPFVNTVYIDHDAGELQDSATIMVNKVCDAKEEEDEKEDFPTCESNPELPECDKCKTNPELPECQPKKTCETDPEMEGCKKTCETDPDMEGCKKPDELPKTGPAEIVMASVIVLGLGIWGIYYIHTKKNLSRVKASVLNGASDKSDNDKSDKDIS